MLKKTTVLERTKKYDEDEIGHPEDDPRKFVERAAKRGFTAGGATGHHFGVVRGHDFSPGPIEREGKARTTAPHR